MKEIFIDTQKELHIHDGEQVMIFDICDEKRCSQLQNIVLGENVVAQYIFFITDKGKVEKEIHKNILVGRNSKIITRFCAFTDQSFTLHTNIHLYEHAQHNHETFMNVFDLGNVSIQEQYEFHDPSIKAQMRMKIMAFDKVKVNAVGNIIIDKGAQNVDSQLDLHGFILSKQAQISLIPQLQIQANDVKAGHSAKTESVDQDTLFYLQSRGLTLKQATKLFLEGLIIDHVSSISNKDMREYIELVAKETILKRYE